MRFAIIVMSAILTIGAGCGQRVVEEPTAPPAAPVVAPPPARAEMLPSPPSEQNVLSIPPGPDVQTALQEALILAEPGSVIQLEEGVYNLELGLSLDVDRVTLRGRGMDKTILDFKQQAAGSEGLFVTSAGVVLEDFAIVDTKGNGMKSQEADGIVVRRVRAEWTGGPKETNGAYGIYPVSSRDVLVEDCVAIGASDSGVYVGQSKNVIVRRCRAEFNVAGIEIENCHGAEVYDCTATNNTGGILVFDLPDLPQQRGHTIRVANNRVYGNNTPNFAPKGNIVAKVPPGMGIMVMANSNVEITGNEVRDHATSHFLIVSYLATSIPIRDPNYYPYPEGIHIHGNTLGIAGNAPGGELGIMLAALTGTPTPDIVWDGVVNPAKLVDGKLPPELQLYIHDNTKPGGEITFASLGGQATLDNPLSALVQRDITAHAGSLPSLPPIHLPGDK